MHVMLMKYAVLAVAPGALLALVALGVPAATKTRAQTDEVRPKRCRRALPESR